MSIKQYNKITKQWEIFPGTAGKNAYLYAQDAGYTGTEEEFASLLANSETVLRKESEITNSADYVHYPSSKAVKDYIDNKIFNITEIPLQVIELVNNATDIQITTAFSSKHNFLDIWNSVYNGNSARISVIKDDGTTKILSIFDITVTNMPDSDGEHLKGLTFSLLFPSINGPYQIRYISILYSVTNNIFTNCSVINTTPFNWI